MRSAEEVDAVWQLVADGLSDVRVSEITGVPRSTLRNWKRTDRRPDQVSKAIDVQALPAADYAYLLGAYLGDGTITSHARGVSRLSIYLDSRYPLIVEAVAEAMESVLPGQRAWRGLHPTHAMVTVAMYSKQWPCLFPQHGPGRKHERPIFLADWQQRIVDDHHEPFLRGLIHSDGCRHINRVWRNGKAYEYSRYNFTNASADIRALFCASCDALGIPWRRMNARNISVARREAVARLDEFVGPKR